MLTQCFLKEALCFRHFEKIEEDPFYEFIYSC